MSREAMKQALEALELYQSKSSVRMFDDAVKALRQALETEQLSHQGVDWEKLYRLEVKKKEALAAKYERDIKPLTKIVPMTQPAQQQEPVAWVDLIKEADEIVRGKVLRKRFIDDTPLANDIAVWMAYFAQKHASPPKQWVGLTDEDIHDAFNFTELVKQLSWDREPVRWCENFSAYIEAKLREKNT